MKRFVLAFLTVVLTACGSIGGGRPPIEPPKPVVQAMAVILRDYISPEVPIAGVLVTCETVTRGATNEDGYLSFTATSEKVIDCDFVKEGYESRSASHYLTPSDTTLYVPMTKDVPPVPVTPAAMVGRVRIEGDCFRDDTGCVLPLYAHAGDLFSLYTRNPSRALQELDSIANAGYHGLRTWSTLGCDGGKCPDRSDYWYGREVGPLVTPDYYGRVREFFSHVKDRRLRLVWSQGDIKAIGDRRDTMTRFAQLDNEFGGVIDFIDCGNEAWQTGESDPRKLAECVSYYRDAGGRALKSLTSADGDPTYQDINKWSISPADVFDVHSWRGGHSWDKRRHIWSYTYCGEGCPALRFGIGSEPPGNGALVSVTSNKHELDDEAVSLLAVASMTGRQAFVWFSGEGVKIDQGLHVESGFASSPRMVAKLPKDMMQFETSHHSGTSWSNVRVLEVPNDIVRIDGRISNGGRFVYVIDGPEGTHSLRVARSFSGQLCDPATVECVDVSRNAGERLEVAFRRGRVLIGQVR